MFSYSFISLILDINVRHMFSLLISGCIPYLSSDIVLGSCIVRRGRSGPLHAFKWPRDTPRLPETKN